MKTTIEREATFENNSDMEVKVTQKQLSRFVCLVFNGTSAQSRLLKPRKE